jgi:hypothetical protein
VPDFFSLSNWLGKEFDKKKLNFGKMFNGRAHRKAESWPSVYLVWLANERVLTMR